MYALLLGSWCGGQGEGVGGNSYCNSSFVDSQLPSTQNNPFVKVAYFRGQILSSASSFHWLWLKNSELGGFTGSSVVKNPLANRGAIGWILGPERSHMPLSNKVHAPQLLSLCSRAWKPQLPKPTWPRFSNKRSHCNEKPTHHNRRLAPTQWN